MTAIRFWLGTGSLGTVLAAILVVTPACGSKPEQSTVTTVTAATVPSARVPPAVSINAMMVALVDHAAHSVWDAATKPPANDNDWQQLEYHAMQLAAAGTLISTGGTGPADPGWVLLPAWQQSSQRLADDGVAALQAARKRDAAALSTVGDRLLENCEGCHKQFKPDVPTEGLVHRPEYGH
jgi:hypothetical protein